MIESIKKRSAIRKYHQTPLNQEILDKVENIIKTQKGLFDIKYKVDVVLDGQSFREVLGGVIGSYGKVHAPHYLVASTELTENAYENIGYLVEYIVLKLTEMNLGTCWIGGGIKRDLFKDYLKLEDDLTPVVVIAFGYPQDNGMFRNDISQFKRKSLEQITMGEFMKYEVPMELVRIAPSAVNSQPWRYEFVENNRVNIYRVKQNIITKNFIGEMNRIDLGISLCHFEIGLKELHKKMQVLELPIYRKNLIYFKSLNIED